MYKSLFLFFILFSNATFAADNWSLSPTKDENGKQYQIYSNLSLNSIQGNQVALILVSPKKNIFTKIGFAQTEGSISCPNFCQYYVQFDHTAAKYTFSIENKSIKLEHSQQEDFLKNIQHSKEMTLILNSQRFYFNLEKPNWSFTSDDQK